MITIRFKDGYIMVFADAIKGESFVRSADKKEISVVVHSNGTIEHF